MIAVSFNHAYIGSEIMSLPLTSHYPTEESSGKIKLTCVTIPASVLLLCLQELVGGIHFNSFLQTQDMDKTQEPYGVLK